MPIRVLLVDDNAAHVDLFRLLMELDDELDLVGTAPDGEAGITLARELHPDLIVSDIEMPRLDGLSAVPGYREAAPAALVVLMSSREPTEAAVAARAAHADVYIDKGIGVDTVLDMLKDAVATTTGSAPPPVIDLRREAPYESPRRPAMTVADGAGPDGAATEAPTRPVSPVCGSTAQGRGSDVPVMEGRMVLTRMPDPMTWLAAGIPLTLLIDLLTETGPSSARLYGEEPGDTGWVPQQAA